MIDASEYNITIKRIIDDGEVYFRAKVKEFPDLEIYENNPEDSYSSMIAVIEDSIELLAEVGKEIPVPLNEEDYSGRVTLRMPKSLHRRVANMAEVEGCSLNQYLITAISSYSSLMYEKEKRKARCEWIQLERNVYSGALIGKKVPQSTFVSVGGTGPHSLGTIVEITTSEDNLQTFNASDYEERTKYFQSRTNLPLVGIEN